MKINNEMIKKYLESRETGNEKIPVTDILYYGHLENNESDAEEIVAEFGKLDMVLSKLTLSEYDRVWDAACRLCDMHERRGFLSGLQIGTALMVELFEK